jgi:hypothetical protein
MNEPRKHRNRVPLYLFIQRDLIVSSERGRQSCQLKYDASKREVMNKYKNIPQCPNIRLLIIWLVLCLFLFNEIKDRTIKKKIAYRGQIIRSAYGCFGQGILI